MTEESEPRCVVTIRVRGVVRGSHEARETLGMLHLARNNYAALVDNRPSFLGMLKAAQNFITWGEISKETLKMLLVKRARLKGDEKITEEYLQKIGYKSIDELADAVFDCKVKYWQLRDIVPFFRLRPPSKGYKGSVKKSVAAGGESGYRGAKIDDLISRML
jgi:large subunit ribosomal protein L30